LVEKIRETLDKSVTELDSSTMERLRMIRMAAVDASVTEKRPWFAVPIWITAGGIAAVAVIIIALSLRISAPRQNLIAGQIEDIDILTSHEHLEIYEDMEFYRWLASEQNVR